MREAGDHQISIMVVDDDLITREVIESRTPAEGLWALIASSGEEALAIMEKEDAGSHPLR